MKNLISKKLALLAIVLFASIGHAFGQSITFDFNGVNDNSNFTNADVLVNQDYWVSINDTYEFSSGEDVTIEVYAYNVYCLDKVYVDGQEIAFEDNTYAKYVFESISGIHTVKVVCKKLPTNSISLSMNYPNVASVCFEGTRDGRCFYDSEEVEVATGGNLKLRLYPNSTAYPVNSVKVDGNDVTAAFMAGNCTLTNISADHTVEITFETVASHTITVNSPENTKSFFFEDVESGNTFRWSSMEFAAGKDVRLYYEPETGYKVNKAFITDSDGNSVNTVTAANDFNTKGYYEFKSLAADYEVSFQLTDATPHTVTVDFDNVKGWVDCRYYRSDPEIFNSFVVYPNTPYSFNEGISVRLIFGVRDEFSKFKSIEIDGNGVTPNYDDNYGCYYYDLSNLSADHTVAVTFEDAKSVSVCFDSDRGSVDITDYGTIAPCNTLTYSPGSTVRITPHANEGYIVKYVTVDDTPVTLTNGYYEFTLTEDCSVYVEFERPTHSITYSFNRENVANVVVEYDGNTIDVNNNNQSLDVYEGDDVSMSINVYNSRYTLKKIMVDGVENNDNGPFTISDVSADHTVYIEFETIEPTNCVSVSLGQEDVVRVAFSGSYYQYADHTCSIDLPTGENAWLNVELLQSPYQITQIIVDGNNIMPECTFSNSTYSYLISNVSNDFNVTIEFEPVASNTISVSIPGIGGADVRFEDGYSSAYNHEAYNYQAVLASGRNVKMYIEPYVGNAVSSVIINDGSNPQDVTSTFQANGGYYEFLSLSKDYTVEVGLETVKTHTIRVNYNNSELGKAYLNYSWIDPENGNRYNEGSTVRLTADAYEGYMVESIYVGSNDVTASFKANGYYDIVVNSDINITINFVVARYYEITVDCGPNGLSRISDSNPLEGSDVELVITPNDGYSATVYVDGSVVPLTFTPYCSTGSYKYVFVNVQASHEVEVTFTPVGTSDISFAFNNSQIESVELNKYWSFSSNDYETVTNGTTAILKVRPKIGYEVASVKAGDTDITNSLDEEGYYSFVVVSECTVTITMKKKTTTAPVPFTLSELGEGTFCCEYDLDFSNVRGIKAYVASGFNPSTNQLVLTRVDEAPAGTGLLIKGTSGEYLIPTTNSNFLFANMLKGVVEKTDIPVTDWYNGWYGSCNYTNYIFGTDGQFRRTDGEELPANSAYLILPTMFVENSSLAKIGLIFLDDEEEVGGITTGVGYIWAGEKRTVTTDAIYNLQGQKVTEKSLKPGIYIKNGKKFMVK